MFILLGGFKAFSSLFVFGALVSFITNAGCDPAFVNEKQVEGSQVAIQVPATVVRGQSGTFAIDGQGFKPAKAGAKAPCPEVVNFGFYQDGQDRDTETQKLTIRNPKTRQLADGSCVTERVAVPYTFIEQTRRGLGEVNVVILADGGLTRGEGGRGFSVEEPSSGGPAANPIPEPAPAPAGGGGSSPSNNPVPRFGTVHQHAVNGSAGGASSKAVGTIGGPNRAVVAAVESGSADPDTLQVFPVGTSGISGPPASFSLGAGKGPEALVVADLDGDTDEDVAVAAAGSNEVLVLKNNGSNVFGTPQAISTGAGTRPVAIDAGDLGGDALPDLVTANGESASASRILNAGGTFGTAAAFEAGGITSGVAVEDLDGGGMEDVAFSLPGDDGASNGQVRVRRNLGSGNFTSSQTVLSDAAYPLAVRAQRYGGLPLLAVVEHQGARIAVLPNTSGAGSISFGSPTRYAAGTTSASFPVDLAFGNFDADGSPDFANANFGEDSFNARLYVGANLFGSKSTTFAFGSPSAIDAGRVDDDSLDDVVLALGSQGVGVAQAQGRENTSAAPSSAGPKAAPAAKARKIRVKVSRLLADNRVKSKRSYIDPEGNGRLVGAALGGKIGLRFSGKGVPRGLKALRKANFAGRADAKLTFLPPVNPVELRGFIVARSPRSRKTAVCMKLSVAGDKQRLTVLGGTGKAKGVGGFMDLDKASLDVPRNAGSQTFTVRKGAKRLTGSCRSLLKKVPR